jgi:hypothetical protein
VHCCRKSPAGLLSLIAKVSASRLLQSNLRSVDIRLWRVCGSCFWSVMALPGDSMPGDRVSAHLDNDTVPHCDGRADWGKHRVQECMRARYDIHDTRSLASVEIVVAQLNLPCGSQFILWVQGFIMLAQFRQDEGVFNVRFEGCVAHIGSDGRFDLIFRLGQFCLQSVKL